MERRNSKLSNVSIGMGGTLIVTIFVSLCLTIFSILSFTTAYSDLKLAKKTEEITYDYYELHGKAEETLAEIYVLLMSANETYKSSSKEILMDKAAGMVTKINGVSIVDSSRDSFSLYYESPGNKNQKICVTLNVMYDEINNIFVYDIQTWNLASIEIPLYEEENYNLWEGFE